MSARVPGCRKNSGSMQVLPEIVPVTLKRMQALQAFLEKAWANLPGFLTKEEREVLLFFSCRKPVTNNAADKFLQLTSSSSPEHISLLRCVVHTIASAFSAGSNCLMALFRSLIAQPGSLLNSFLPCMPEDVQSMAVRVLGGRWYKCPNVRLRLSA